MVAFQSHPGLGGFKMLSKTSELAVQTLVFLCLAEDQDYIPPARIAEAIGASPSYTTKVTSLLVRAGILKAQRGARGGVQLGRSPVAITLLDTVEACQGRILGDYCAEYDNLDVVCSYHRAMHELHGAITSVLRRWTVADLIKQPCAHKSILDQVNCKMKWSANPSRLKSTQDK
ncbi:Rrf2 family transcriptional regulator [bacterium]|nr:Rrf2 family transcriptional regulator [bacterium]